MTLTKKGMDLSLEFAEFISQNNENMACTLTAISVAFYATLRVALEGATQDDLITDKANLFLPQLSSFSTDMKSFLWEMDAIAEQKKEKAKSKKKEKPIAILS